MKKTLTEDQANALLSFIQGFEETTTGVWAHVAEWMRENGGIDDPEAALEDAREALQA